MLALKVVLAENDQIPTLIFDEIDAGIGGLTVQAVAERLYYAAQNKQVICVTHAPHIAGRAQTHFISVSAAGGKTRLRYSNYNLIIGWLRLCACWAVQQMKRQY